MDSTSLIWKYLQDGHKVAAGYFAFANNHRRTRCELRAIKRMLPFLRQYPFKYKGAMGWFEWNYGTNTNFRHPHCPVWITVCAMLNEDFDEMAIGYLRDDGITVSDLSDFQSLFKSLQLFTHRTNKLAIPLFEASKKELLGRLPVQLKKHIWMCDDPQGKSPYRPCGRCNSCKIHAKALRGN